MTAALLRKGLRDLRGQILGWGLGLGVLLGLTVGLYPSIASTYAEAMSGLPEGFLAFFGGELALDTLQGYLNAEFFSYAPLTLAVFAIMAGTGVLSGEEGQGTLDVLLAQPVSRRRVAVTKHIALLVAMAGAILLMMAAFWLSLLFINVEVPVGRILAAFALLWPFTVAVAYLSVLLSLIVPGRLAAGVIIAIYLVGSYILDSLANLVSWLANGRPVFLTAYYRGGEALLGDISWVYVGGLLALVVVVPVLSLWLFETRDIGVRASLREWKRLPLLGPTKQPAEGRPG